MGTEGAQDTLNCGGLLLWGTCVNVISRMDEWLYGIVDGSLFSKFPSPNTVCGRGYLGRVKLEGLRFWCIFLFFPLLVFEFPFRVSARGHDSKFCILLIVKMSIHDTANFAGALTFGVLGPVVGSGPGGSCDFIDVLPSPIVKVLDQ